MDGVLVHSNSIHETAYRTALAEIGVNRFNYDEIAGVRTDEAMGLILAASQIVLPPESFRKLIARKRDLAIAAVSERDLMPECRNVISLLAAKIKIGLATSASRRLLERFLDLSQTRGKFLATVSGEDVRAGKPHPEIFQRCATILGETAEQCLVVEDSQSGIEAAAAGGFRVLLFQSLQPIKKERIPIVGEIQNLSEIESYL